MKTLGNDERRGTVAPLTGVALGFLLMVLDVRIDGVDYVPDVLGWAVCTLSLLAPARRSSWLLLAFVAAVLGTVNGTLRIVLKTGFDADFVLLPLLVFACCSGILELGTDRRTASSANALRWGMLGIAGLIFVLGTLTEEEGRINGLASAPMFLLLGVAVVLWIWFFIFACKARVSVEAR